MKKARISRRNKATLVLAAANVVMIGQVATQAASPYTWTGHGPDSNWSTLTNWDTTPPVKGPGNGDTAILGNVPSDRTVIYDTGANNTLTSLSLTESGGAVNTLDVQKSFGLGTALVLASSSGTSKLMIEPPLTGGTVTVTLPSLVINPGGVVEMSGYAYKTGASTTVTAETTLTSVNGVTLSGGTLISDRGYSPSGTSAIRSTINGPFTMTGGTISFATMTSSGLAASPPVSSDAFTPTQMPDTFDRMIFNGAVSITAGTMIVGTASTTGDPTNPANELYFSGPSTYITGLTSPITALTFLTPAAGTTFRCDTTLSGGLFIKVPTSTVSIGATSSGGTLYIESGFRVQPSAAGAAINLNFLSNVQTKNVVLTQYSGASCTANIDLAGFSLIEGTAVQGFSPAAAMVFNITNSAGALSPSTISAGSFTMAGSNVTIGSDINLVSRVGGTSSTLSAAAGSISAASTFTYAPTTLAGSAATLSSSRAIGSIAVQNGGTLVLGTSLDASAAGATVASGSTLALNALTLSAGNLTVAGTVSGTSTSRIISSGTFTGTGTIGAGSGGISSSGTFSAGTVGTADKIVLASGVLTLAGTDRVDINDDSSFDQVSISGGSVVLSGTTIDAEFKSDPQANGSPTTYQIFSAGVTGTYSLASNLDDRYTLSFNPGSGQLTVTPEPTSLATLGGAALMLLQRRRRARRTV